MPEPTDKTKRTEGSGAVAPRRAEFDLLGGWPFRELLAPSGRLARAFEDMFGEADRPARGCTPPMDVHEDEKHYVITTELPGIRKEDISVEVHEGVLTLHGEKKNEREEKGDRRRWIERSYGSFTRSFTLPANADADHVDAGFQNGVLTLKIPKIEPVKPRTIAVK